MIEKALKQQLDKKGISTYKLAKETGIKYELLRRVFKGARKLTADELVEILLVTDIDIKDITKEKNADYSWQIKSGQTETA